MSAGGVQWQSSECAMKKYPMRIIDACFILTDGETVPLTDSRVICNGWGEVGSLRLETDAARPLPTGLRVNWYSYAEDLFFSGEFSLPVEKLQQQFSEGCLDPITGEREEFEFILVGLALEGYVSLWIVGGGTTREIADFRGRRVEQSFESVFGSEIAKIIYQEEAIECLQETAGLSGETIKLPIPKDYWKTCHQKVPTKVFLGGGDNAQLWLKTTNGECQFFDAEEGAFTEAILARIEGGFLFWESLDERSWRAEFSMDEDEVFWAYERAKELAPDAPVTLEVELGNKYPVVHIQLKFERWLVPLNPILHSVAPG
jgi:hypothetical protein